MESAELIAILREVRERVRARNPATAAGGIDVALPDLLPLVHARDAALGKVAAIGSVNPRSGGLVNAVVQTWKRLVARVLDWHVREQVEFNRKILTFADAVIEANRQMNQALAEFSARIAEQQNVAEEMKDTRNHWASWRAEWEHKLSENEIQFLRSVADLQGGFQHRVTLMEASHRDLMHTHNVDFHAALERHGFDIQKRLWADLEKMHTEIERIIHSELRLVRQRAQVSAPVMGGAEAAAPATTPPLTFDYARFAERFRGSEDYVNAGQQIYLPYFEGRKNVLDIGCGRGEFLKLMRTAGVSAKGIELSAESVAICRSQGLEAEVADVYPYLGSLPEGSLDGIFCSQVVEHLPPDRLPELIRLCAQSLAPGGVIAIETPNPECLAIFATHFYLDPTHTRPVPHPLLIFYLEEFGVGNIEVKRLSPAKDSMPALNSLPEDFRDAFFGALDYAVIGRKL
ncbi:MAG TPA: class I SAM-dependent methyltransferase [Bryobacteraceae bacterium]|nr:class I SAM-dependent methyltransferase [Bryobacteraceae bacterium]